MKTKLFINDWSRTLVFGLLSSLFLGFNANSQALPECTANVPTFIVDLSQIPNQDYTTPEFVRQATCCGDGDRYVAFYVTLSPEVAMFELVVAPGYADPIGSGNYQIISGGDLLIPGICGPNIPAGDPVCITGSGPHKILYSKPGGNDVKYIFKQIPKPVFPQDDTTRVGCSLPLNIYGLDNIVITSINSSTGNTTPGAYNGLLNITDPTTPIFTPGLATPSWIDYQICGTPQAAVCGSYASCDTVRIYTRAALDITVTPNPATFCAGDSVELTAFPVGGDLNYTLSWLNSAGIEVGSADSIFVSQQGTYTAQVADGLVSPTCPVAYISVPVTVGLPPTADAGADVTVCATSPATFLAGSVTNAPGGFWTGGMGNFNPSPDSLLVVYTPTAAELDSGYVTLILTSSGAGGGCAEYSDSVTIFFSDTVYTNPSFSPILCNGGTSTVNANATGGSGSYTYLWSNGATTASILVPSGTYTVTAKDIYGCESTSSILVPQPNALSLNLTSTNTSTDIACDGSASVSIFGGTSPYAILWETLETTTTINGLCYGAYDITITDANNCVVSSSVVVNNQTCSLFNVTANNTHVSCYGDDDAQAFATPSGGTSPYSYSWNTAPVQTTQNATGLSAGTYTVTVTDNVGCIDMANVTVLQPTVITNTITHTDATTISGTDGTATANPLGGSPGYSYSWVPGAQTTQTATGLSAGTYYLTIQDAKNCIKTDSVLINQPPCNDFMVYANPKNISCNGLTNGSAYIIISQGTPPYAISWSSGQTNVTSVSGLAAGNYTVTVTDASNCTTFTTFDIVEPNVLTVGLAGTNISCFNAADGTIDLEVSGGVFPYSFDWYLGASSFAEHEDLTWLSPGTYSVIVSDANGCEATGTVGITQPTKLLATLLATDILCYNDGNGSIDATVSGGTLPYTYSWNGPSGYTSFSVDIAGLQPGLYTLEVEDGNGCTIQPVEEYIDQPAPIGVVDYTVDCPIPGQLTTLVTLDSISGGSGEPYSVSFDGGLNFQTAGDYTAVLPVNNTYNVVVEDNNGCDNFLPFSIAIDPVVTITSVTFDPCVYAGTSTINVNVVPAGGDGGPYQVSTDGGLTFGTSGVYTLNLAVGQNYNIVVRDTSECQSTATPITIPSPFVATGLMTAEASCPGAMDGAINLTISGGTIPYTIAWTGPLGYTSALEDISGLYAGTYNVTVTDNNSCQVSTPVLVTTTPDITPPVITSCSAGVQPVNANVGTCTYTVSGTAWDATATDDCLVASISYNLTGATGGSGTSLNGVVFNLGTTTVTWSVVDGSGNISTCSYDVIVIDTQLPVITSCSGAAVHNETTDLNACTYTHNGTGWDATASDNCTVTSISYVLTGVTTGSGTSLNGVVFNLGTTTVTWTAIDTAGNTVTCDFDVVVTDDQLPAITSCSGAAVHNETTDLNACTYTHSGTGWDATASDNCTVTSISYVLTGVTTGSGTSLNGIVFNLGTTTVTWTAIDTAGNTVTCDFDVVVTDDQLPAITSCSGAAVHNETTDLNACTYTHSGTGWDATASDNCTVTSISYVLTGVTTGSGTSLDGVVFNLGTTTVTWTAIDTAGNIVTCDFDVIVEDEQLPTILNCPTDISVSNTLGNCGSVVSWTAPTFTDNCGGSITSTHAPGAFFPVGTTTVTYTVTDGSGNQVTCVFEVEVLDTELPQISCQADVETCNPVVTFPTPGASDNCGIVSVTQTSGLPSGSSFPVGTTLVTFTALDVNGNTNSCAFNVIINPTPVLTLTPTNVSCFSFGDGSIDLAVSNGSAPYDYNWSNGAATEDISGLQPGTYSVTVTDDNGCFASSNTNITEPLPLTAHKVVTNVSCNGGNDGAIDFSVEGGTLPYSFDWTNGAVTEDISGLIADVYQVTVTDANGCELINNTVITEPEALSLVHNVQNAACSSPNGSITVIVNGGTAPYVYDWSDGSSAANLTNVVEGIYTLDVTDAMGCTISLTDTVGSENGLSASVYDKDVLCYGEANGSAIIVVESGTGPFTYEWSNGDTGNQSDDLAAGSYQVTITDAFGCTSGVNFVIDQPDSLYAELFISEYANGYNVSTFGGNDGAVNVSVYGGVPPYEYIWSGPGAFSSNEGDLSGLAVGNYSLTIVDTNGCLFGIRANLNSPAMLDMPEGVSPNNDGDNDYFVVKGLEGFPDNDITIFNRWGNIVYEQKGYQNDWEGQNNKSESLPDGTYYVILNAYSTNGTITLTGYIDLRRN